LLIIWISSRRIEEKNYYGSAVEPIVETPAPKRKVTKPKL
jgi:hypothetical protein